MNFQKSDILVGASAGIEDVYNSMGAAGVLYRGADHFILETRNRTLTIPDKEKSDNLGYVGGGAGAEFPDYQESGYLIPPPIEITGGLNTLNSYRMLRRAMGGADVVTVAEASKAWQHAVAMQLNSSASGRQLPSFTMIHALGAFDNVFGGVVVDTWQLRLPANAGDPEFTATLIGSGKRKPISGYASPVFGAMPAKIPQNFMKGAETVVQFTDQDGGGNPRTIVLSDEKRVRGLTVTLANNHRTDLRSAGDERLDPLSTKKGWYVSQMPHGDRAITGEFTILNDELGREYKDADEDIPITNFIIRCRGHYVKTTGQTISTIHQYLFEITIPNLFFRAPRDAGDTDSELTLGMFVARDQVTLGGMTARVINSTSTAIV